MRAHHWSFLGMADTKAPATEGWTARVIGVCAACGLTRVLTIAGHRDHHFDLSGDCRTPQERAEERRVAPQARAIPEETSGEPAEAVGVEDAGFQGDSPRWREVPADGRAETDRRAHDDVPAKRDRLGALDREDAGGPRHA
jgi:hypothetical protein